MRDSRLEKSVIAEARNSIEESEKTFLRAVRVFNVFLFFFHESRPTVPRFSSTGFFFLENFVEVVKKKKKNWPTRYFPHRLSELSCTKKAAEEWNFNERDRFIRVRHSLPANSGTQQRANEEKGMKQRRYML